MKTITVRIVRIISHVYEVEVSSNRKLTKAEAEDYALDHQGREVDGVNVSEERELGCYQEVLRQTQSAMEWMQ